MLQAKKNDLRSARPRYYLPMKHSIFLYPVFLVVSCLAFASCASPVAEKAAPIDVSAPLAGTVEGKSFAFVSGYAQASTSYPGDYNIFIYNIAPAPGSDPWAFLAYPIDLKCLEIHARMPAAVKQTELKLSFSENDRTITVVDNDHGDTSPMNFVLGTGFFRVDSIDGSKLKGALYATNGESGSKAVMIKGTFEIPIAP